MSPKYKEPLTPGCRDYFIGFVIILALTILGMIIFGLDWGFGGVEAPAIWISIDLFLFVGLREMIRGIFMWRFKRRQILRDKLASNIAEGTTMDFFLYLRPFNSTGRLPITIRAEVTYTKNPGSFPKVNHNRQEIDLETELAAALDPIAPLVALGRPGEYIGAGRINTDDEKWQSQFLDLASRAKMIFIVPATTLGTHWELDRLEHLEPLRKKTLLIIPPLQIDEDGRLFDFIGSMRSDALEALATRGMSIKDVESSRGLLMHFSSKARSVPIVTYVTPATQAGLLGWYLNSMHTHTHGKAMKLGLRNAIFSIEPRLAKLYNSS